MKIFKKDLGIKGYPDFERRFSFKGLGFKMFLSYIIIAVLSMGSISYIYYTKVAEYSVTEQENKYLNITNNLANTISNNEYITNKDYENLQNVVKMKARNEGHRTLVFDTNSVVIADSSEMAIDKFYDIAEVNRALAGEDSSNVNKKNGTVFATSSIVDKEGNIQGVVLSADTVQTDSILLEDIKDQSLMFAFILIVAVLILVYFMTTALVAPLYRMIEVIGKMSEGHLNKRIEIETHDEYKVLGDAFNEMADKLEKVEQTRDEFVSNVSHELKTPLSSIKVLTEAILLQQNVETEMYIEFLQDINSEVDRMTNIVNDLLALVKLDQSEITLNIQEVDSAEFLNNLIKRLRPLAQKKNIELVTDIAEDVKVEVDIVKISLAISNIIENAIKYTNSDGEGVVKITTMFDNQSLFIDVTDNGIGMNNEELSKIFTRFYRVDKTRDRETGGTGLGLSITHSTILLHNGNIRVRSVEDEGTTFLIRIPVNYVKGSKKDSDTTLRQKKHNDRQKLQKMPSKKNTQKNNTQRKNPPKKNLPNNNV